MTSWITFLALFSKLRYDNTIKNNINFTYGGNNMEKRLYRNMNDKKLCGVCSGIADYFSLDPTLVRLGWAALVLFAGSGILAYILAALIIPEKPQNL